MNSSFFALIVVMDLIPPRSKIAIPKPSLSYLKAIENALCSMRTGSMEIKVESITQVLSTTGVCLCRTLLLQLLLGTFAYCMVPFVNCKSTFMPIFNI